MSTHMQYIDAVAATAHAEVASRNQFMMRCRWIATARWPDGSIKWMDEVPMNLVVDTGVDFALDSIFNASAYTSDFYLLLTDGTPTVAAGDTMASHAGWTEVTAYDEATRQVYNPAAASAKTVTNSAAVATVTIATNSTTIGGVGCTTNSTKGGSTGTLFSVGAFTAGDKLLDDNDTLDLTLAVSG